MRGFQGTIPPGPSSRSPRRSQRNPYPLSRSGSPARAPKPGSANRLHRGDRFACERWLQRDSTSRVRPVTYQAGHKFQCRERRGHRYVTPAKNRGEVSRTSSKAVSGARNSICPAYLRRISSTRDPSTARISMFASSTSNTVNALRDRRSRRSFLKSSHEIFLCCSGRGDQLPHLFAGQTNGFQVGMVRLWLRRDVDPNRGSMPCNGNGRLRFQVAGEVLPKLPNADFIGLHFHHLNCVHNDNTILLHAGKRAGHERAEPYFRFCRAAISSSMLTSSVG